MARPGAAERGALEPLPKAMGDPSSETILNLVGCDPAMGSGGFLVAADPGEGIVHHVADAQDDVVNTRGAS